MRYALFGSGGHATSVLSGSYDNVEFVALYDDKIIENALYKGTFDRMIQDFKSGEFDKIMITIGNVAVRKALFDKTVSELGLEVMGNLISKYSITSETNYIEYHGLFVGAKSYLGPNLKLSNNLIINTGAIIEHDCEVGENSFIGPSVTICGFSKIGSNNFVGAGSTINNNIRIKSNIIIGAGAVVVNDLSEAGTYLGLPAKLKYKEKC